MIFRLFVFRKKLVCCLVSVLIAISTPAWCDSTASSESSQHHWWSYIAGQPVNEQLYLGMWTEHTSASSREKDNATNDSVSFVHHGYFFCVFKNSYYDWSYAAGVQRDVYQTDMHTHHSLFKLGYRAAAIVGYDDRLCHGCGSWPAIPVVVPYVAYQYKNVGIESQYGVILYTLSFYYHFS